MPDEWEYVWYASWDLAFHSVVLGHTDSAMAKNQLLLARMIHASERPVAGLRMELPRCESAVQVWAELAMFRVDGAKDFDFLARVFNKLLINFTW